VTLSDAKRRLLEHLARRSGATVAELADVLALTPAAIRQHLNHLLADGLVTQAHGSSRQGGRGRRPGAWQVADRGREVLPDRHRELAEDLLHSMDHVLGAEQFQAVLADRDQRQRERYRATIGDGPLRDRVGRLAQQRSNEGYVAEVRVSSTGADGALELIEHHCPVAAAARACGGLCDGELETFRAVLGASVTVERRMHLGSGDHCCSYEVRPLRS
jgi:iron-sulfur cluster biosynthesis transcriptional regulator SufR